MARFNKQHFRLLLRLLTCALIAVSVNSCASAKKKKDTPELSELKGKKVAVLAIEGEATQKKVVEVALVNQLTQRGTFILVSKQDVEEARSHVDQNPMSWKEIAKRAGADYALRVKVLDFTAQEHEGYSKEIVEDSQMEAERGESQVEQVYKVKSLEGKVRFQLEFTNLEDQDTRIGIAERQDKVVEEAKKAAIHLPPKMRFLENLSNQAFSKFFEQYN